MMAEKAAADKAAFEAAAEKAACEKALWKAAGENAFWEVAAKKAAADMHASAEERCGISRPRGGTQAPPPGMGFGYGNMCWISRIL